MPYASRPLADRLMDHISLDENGCWLWDASTRVTGYGQVWIGTKRAGTHRLRGAHRACYQVFREEIAAGLHLDHLCRVRRCVNPWHLEVVTQAENNRRAGAAKTHCAHGHSLDDAYLQNGRRYCRTCKISRSRDARRKVAK